MCMKGGEVEEIFYENMNTPWEVVDEKYLIDWYDVAGPEEMAFALGRTVRSVMQRVINLRKTGVMVKPLIAVHFKRIKKESFAEDPK